MTTGRLLKAFGGTVLACAACIAAAGAAQPAREMPHAAIAASNQPIEVLPVQGNIYLLAGAGGNVAIQVGQEGVLLVDTGAAQYSDEIIREIRKLSPLNLQIIVNTHVHADHTGGNAAISKIGQSIGESPDFRDVRDGGDTNFATIYAQENVLTRMSRPGGPYSAAEAGWPTDTYFVAAMDFTFNDEGIRILHQPRAHTDGDSFVYFRGSNVVVAGDIFTMTGYPVIDEETGGSIDGLVDALNALVDITIPRNKQEGGTMVIPGRGRLADEADVVYYRDMVTIIRDRIRDMVDRKMSLKEVIAARPTKGYDLRFGGTDPKATEQFVAAAYRSLVSKKSPQ